MPEPVFPDLQRLIVQASHSMSHDTMLLAWNLCRRNQPQTRASICLFLWKLIFFSNYSSSLLSKGLLSIDSLSHSKPQTQHIKWKPQQINKQLTNLKLYNILNTLIKSMSHSGHEQYLCLVYSYCICHGPMVSSHLGYHISCRSSTLLTMGRRKTKRTVLHLSENTRYSRVFWHTVNTFSYFHYSI